MQDAFPGTHFIKPERDALSVPLDMEDVQFNRSAFKEFKREMMKTVRDLNLAMVSRSALSIDQTQLKFSSISKIESTCTWYTCNFNY